MVEDKGEYLAIEGLKWIIPPTPQGIGNDTLRTVEEEMKNTTIIHPKLSPEANYLNNFWGWIDFDGFALPPEVKKKLSAKKKMASRRSKPHDIERRNEKIRTITQAVHDELARAYPEYDTDTVMARLGLEIFDAQNTTHGDWNTVTQQLFPAYLILRMQGYGQDELVT